MTQDSELPLGPPPRKAYVRRGVRNFRRAYATVFGLLILVFGGWAVADAVRWPELTSDQRVLTVGFSLAALTAFAVYGFVSHPLRRELRLARRGEVAQGQIVRIGKTRWRRARPIIVYKFQTATGAIFEGECMLPRRLPIGTLEPSAVLEVLYDPKRPRLNKPRLALEYVEFGTPPPRAPKPNS